MKPLSLVLLAAIILLQTGCTNSGSPRIRQFESALEEVRDSMHNVSLAVVYVNDNRIAYSRTFGYRNLADSNKLQTGDLFRIASISKSFTTTALLQQAEQGRVSLQDDVSDLIGFRVRNPRWPDRPITLEMLLSHTSSLCDDAGYFTLDVLNPDSTPDPSASFKDYAPGTDYEYCNLNMNMAGAILERLCGTRFDLYIDSCILRPLGLYGGYDTDRLDRSRLASLYHVSPSGEAVCTDEEAYCSRREALQHYRLGYDTPVLSPTGGMKLSAESLARYMLMHLNYGTTPDGVRILQETSARNMQMPRSQAQHYGLSLWQTDRYSPGVLLTGHTGSAYGMRSAMFFRPETKQGFVVISGGAAERYEDDENILDAVLSLMYSRLAAAD
ncbi:MAG: beta-lactamase family protein [Paludibacteraceae bacterium]|nr:beta-lactamase family protein [Paludibacteraceae bacterium]